MADDRPVDQPLDSAQELHDDAGASNPAEGEETTTTNWAAWGNLWQIPAILLSLTLIGLGVRAVMNRAPKNDFNAALAQVEQFISGGHLEPASDKLVNAIEPNLHEATQAQQAWYNAVVADWLAAWQQSEGISDPGHNQSIDQAYATAVELGAELSPLRLERWADALIDLGKIDAAESRLHELEAMELHGSAAEDVRARRNRILRRIVEHALSQEDLSFDSMMALLARYRGDDRLRFDDLAWAAARQAELRLEAGRPQEAVDNLLVDMRRLDSVSEDADPASFAELYALLGRGYYDLGNYPYAEYQLGLVLDLVEDTDDTYGLAMLLLGQIDVHRGNLEEAFGKFDRVVRDFPDTTSRIPALLQRAEVRSVLGDHDGSRQDYDRLIDLIAEAAPRRDVTARRIGRSLCDRHDAALATGRLELALDYVTLARRLFTAEEIPADVLLRVASTSRQIADDLIAEAKAKLDRSLHSPEDIDPAVRAEANHHYEQAGEYYVRHARVMMEMPSDDEDWADSLWNAADSYDLGGRPDLAIKHFLEYLAGRSTSDPRRAEVTYRLARAYQADQEFQSAVDYYQQVISEHPNSTFASQSYVPQAQSLVRLGRPAQARDLLVQVVEGGSRVLTPDSIDYRDALVALGTILYDEVDYRRAIERLTEAVGRYPDHPRFGSVLFRLADSYRGSAEAAAGRLREEPTLSPVERQQLQDQRTAHLEKAAELFDQVCDFYAKADPEHLDASQLQFQRNAHMYRGDCAFALGRWKQAIEYYDFAARAHSDDYSSLVALIQIVNCYHELGDPLRAATAHERARVRVEQLDDDAFTGRLMNPEAWRRWLDNNPPGGRKTASAASTG